MKNKKVNKAKSPPGQEGLVHLWFNVGYEDLKGIDAENFLFGISNGEGVEIDFSFATKIDRIIEAVLNASEKKTWIEVSNEKEWKT